jgi:DNA polymerase
MSNRFLEFQNQVDAILTRCSNGEITTAERDELVRQLQLPDEQWGDVWMLSPSREWFRKASGSDAWIHDYPIALTDPNELPPIAQMNLRQLARAIHDCTLCPLHRSRSRAVPGEGAPKADIMLIGEGPGFHEDKQARPFVGASGKFLEQLLNDIGYKREAVFIANVVKCRPPGNRDPQAEELSACGDYLDRQIELVDPKVIVTLGRYSMVRYFPGAAITKIHGQAKRVGNRLIVPMFHPAAALHQPKWRPLIIEDFAKLPRYIEEAAAFGQNGATDSNTAQQLSMF